MSDNFRVEAVASVQRVVLFDGHCNLCHSAVDFIIRRDSKEVFYFSPLTSQWSQTFLESQPQISNLDSLFLYQNGEVYDQSTAALMILKELPYLWSGFYYLFIIVPRSLRDWGYRMIARNRYKWFGRRQACRVPTEKEKSRFLS